LENHFARTGGGIDRFFQRHYRCITNPELGMDSGFFRNNWDMPASTPQPDIAKLPVMNSGNGTTSSGAKR
jgi:hypothetical protein